MCMFVHITLFHQVPFLLSFFLFLAHPLGQLTEEIAQHAQTYMLCCLISILTITSSLSFSLIYPAPGIKKKQHNMYIQTLYVLYYLTLIHAISISIGSNLQIGLDFRYGYTQGYKQMVGTDMDILPIHRGIPLLLPSSIYILSFLTASSCH